MMYLGDTPAACCGDCCPDYLTTPFPDEAVVQQPVAASPSEASRGN